MRFKLVCTFRETWNHHVPFNSSTDCSELMYDSLKVGAQLYYKCGMSFDGSRDIHPKIKTPIKKDAAIYKKTSMHPRDQKYGIFEIVTEVATCEDAWGS